MTSTYRDIDALSAAGVPVYAQPGGGGCFLPYGYDTRLTGLTAAEAQVLSLPGPAQFLADLGLGEAVDAAQLKLIRPLPEGVGRTAAAAHERVLVETAIWASATRPIGLQPLPVDSAPMRSLRRWMRDPAGYGDSCPRAVRLDPSRVVVHVDAFQLFRHRAPTHCEDEQTHQAGH